MKRKKSPLLQRHGKSGGTSTDSSDSTKLGVPHRHPPQNATTSSPSVPHPPTLCINVSPASASSSHLALNCSHDREMDAMKMYLEAPVLSGSLLSLGSTEAFASGEEADAGSSSHMTEQQRVKQAIEHVQQKILKAKDLIKIEQAARDENVNEYLKLATNADKQQLHRIKSVFEKKNQKSAQMISQLQKKLENYNKRIRDLETHGLPRGVLRDMGQGLKDVGANIKGGITGLSGSVMSKPREFAHLIKNKFGSADNINSLSKPERCNHAAELNIHASALNTHRFDRLNNRYISDDSNSSVTSGSGPPHHRPEMSHHRPEMPPHVVPPPPPAPSPHRSPRHHTLLQEAVSASADSAPYHISGGIGHGTFDLEPILTELRSQRDEYQHLVEEIESVKGQITQESTYFSQALQEERYRYERLEEQMNDLIELHQNEIENLKQGIADMEEKVQYQSEERLRDVHDVLDSCQTRISRIEHQQHQHLQQLVSLDAVENSQARALLLKLINVALTMLQVILLLVATLSNIIMPFLRTRVRTLTTAFLIFVIVIVCNQWPELLELCQSKAKNFITTVSK